MVGYCFYFLLLLEQPLNVTQQTLQKKFRRRTSTTDELLYAQTNNSIISSATINKQKMDLEAISEGNALNLFCVLILFGS